MKSVLRTSIAYVLGLVSGVALACGVWLFFEDHHATWITSRPVEIQMGEHGEQSIALPKNTELLHQWFFSEGFDQLCLTVNVDGRTRDAFMQSERGGRVEPYWAEP
jgi:hypothetical protein